MSRKQLVLVDFERYRPAKALYVISAMAYASFVTMMIAFLGMEANFLAVSAALGVIGSWIVARVAAGDMRRAQRTVDKED